MKNLLGIIIRLLIIISLIMAAFGALMYFSGASCIKKIDRTIPPSEVASWEITTKMQLYYAEQVDVAEDAESIVSVTMTGWYERVNGKWVKRVPPITLERRIYGEIKAKKR